MQATGLLLKAGSLPQGLLSIGSRMPAHGDSLFVNTLCTGFLPLPVSLSAALLVPPGIACRVNYLHPMLSSGFALGYIPEPNIQLTLE